MKRFVLLLMLSVGLIPWVMAKEKVIVVGAGVSGLITAKNLQAAGYEVVVLEARNRIGGRVWTDRSTGSPLDLGASWIHGTNGNPIKTIADEINTPLTAVTDYDSTSSFDADGVEDPVSDALIDGFQSIYNKFAKIHLNLGEDVSVQSVIDEAVKAGDYAGLNTRILDSIVNTTFEHEHTGAASDLSIAGVVEGEDITGGDVLFTEGYDKITDYLATGLDIRLQTVVSAVTYGNAGVTVKTATETFTGDRVVMTVPLGVLKAGDITFDPALPADKLSAISRLGFGVLNKVWLEFPSVFWDNTDIHNYFSDSKGHFNEWVNWHKGSGKKYLLGFNAAAYGVEIEGKTDEEIVAEAMSILRLMWGNSIPDPVSQVITRWNSDPYAKGSYSYIKVGSSVADRTTLANAVADRLYFAGEATDKDHAATVNGAYDSGVREAAKIVALGNLDADNDGIRNFEDATPNGEDAIVATASAYLMTAPTSVNVSNLHLINTSAFDQRFTATLYAGDGTRLGAPDQLLSDTPTKPDGRLVMSSAAIQNRFGVDPWKGPAVLEVKSGGSFEMMIKLTSPSGLVSNTNCVRKDRVLNIEGFDSTKNKTFVRFINTGDQTLSAIKATLYDKNGGIIGAADTVMVDSLPAKSQVWVNRDDFAAKLGSQWDGEAMLEVAAVDGLKLLNLNFVNNETFFNFSCFENTSGTVYLQTTSTSQNVSYTHLVNTSTVAQQFTGSLYNGDGELLGNADQPLHSGTLAPRSRVILSSGDIETLLGTSAWKGPAVLEVKGTDTFELMTKLTSPSGLISNTNCVRRGEVHNIEGADSADMTFIRFINTGASALPAIKGTLLDSSGAAIGKSTQTLVSSLPAKSSVWLNRDNLADIVGEQWQGEAMLTIASPPDALRLLNLNFINSETFFNFSCYEASI